MSSRTPQSPLLESLAAADAPVYLIDQNRAIAYANGPLSAWVGLPEDELLERHVEYHSQSSGEASGVLSGLCPSPVALSGERVEGAVSCLDREGRLKHRRAEFVPLTADAETPCPVLVLCHTHDLSPEELAESIRGQASSDALHQALIAYRKTEADRLAGPWLLGTSDATARLRRQVQAAVASHANALIIGQPGGGRSEVARLLFQRSQLDSGDQLAPLDAKLLDATQWSSRLRSVASMAGEANLTLLVENAATLTADAQSMLVEVASSAPRLRLLGTVEPEDPPLSEPLMAIAATMVLEVPSLAQRLQELPLLAQWAVENCNAEGEKQIAGLSPLAQQQLGLYSWPGGIAELESLIAVAFNRAPGPRIDVEHLPTVLKQATLAAQLPATNKSPASRLVLDKYLQRIEEELISRALNETDGNKAEAARLLGMTRPRLYRRMTRLGLEEGQPEDSETTGDDQNASDDPTDADAGD